MTFSIVARCSQTGMFGMAVCSSSPAVAARCSHARANVGAAASQNITDPSLGHKLLDLLALGVSAPDAVRIVTHDDEHIEYRQLLAVDGKGRTGVYSGKKTLGIFATSHSHDVACGGNMLKHKEIPSLMAATFQAAPGHLANRILTAMTSAVDAGGEEGPVHSAGLILVRNETWPIVDLRVDWSDGDPVRELAEIWRLYEPQMEAYVTRAKTPGSAPTFNVPGNL